MFIKMPEKIKANLQVSQQKHDITKMFKKIKRRNIKKMGIT